MFSAHLGLDPRSGHNGACADQLGVIRRKGFSLVGGGGGAWSDLCVPSWFGSGFVGYQENSAVGHLVPEWTARKSTQEGGAGHTYKVCGPV